MLKTIKRRRLEAKTDYNHRLATLKSEKSRLIVRKTNRYVIVQIVDSEVAQDKVIAGLSSKDLLEKGWTKEKAGSLKSLGASYLTGFLIAKKVKGKIKEAIFDMGMHRNIQKSRLYAVLKGAIDAGLNIPHDKEALPSLEEIKKNKSTSEIFEKTLDKINKEK